MSMIRSSAGWSKSFWRSSRGLAIAPPNADDRLSGNHEPRKTGTANCRKTPSQPTLSCKSGYFILAHLPSLLRRAGILHRRRAESLDAAARQKADAQDDGSSAGRNLSRGRRGSGCGHGGARGVQRIPERCAVKLEGLGDDDVLLEIAFDALPPLPPHPNAHCRVAGETFYRIRQADGIILRDEKAIDAGVDDVAAARRIGAHDGAAASRGLEQCQRNALAIDRR